MLQVCSIKQSSFQFLLKSVCKTKQSNIALQSVSDGRCCHRERTSR